MTIDKAKLGALADRVMTDRRFSVDEYHRELAVGVQALLAAIANPETVFLQMKAGSIPKPTIRSMVDLYGEVVNGDEAQLLEIARLRAEIERLEGLRPEGPPRPPEGEGLPRYGLRWNGPQQPLTVPMDDGYWTPWHLANVLHKDAERSKRMLLDACVSIGSIGEALGLDMDADADMMIGTVSDLIDGLNRIAKECPLGSPGFAIACEVLGELGVQQEVQP